MTELDKITAATQNDEQNEDENEMDSTSIIETMRADIIAHTERHRRAARAGEKLAQRRGRLERV